MKILNNKYVPTNEVAESQEESDNSTSAAK